jgi:hypothetical protein
MQRESAVELDEGFAILVGGGEGSAKLKMRVEARGESRGGEAQGCDGGGGLVQREQPR